METDENKWKVLHNQHVSVFVFFITVVRKFLIDAPAWSTFARKLTTGASNWSNFARSSPINAPEWSTTARISPKDTPYFNKGSMDFKKNEARMKELENTVALLKGEAVKAEAEKAAVMLETPEVKELLLSMKQEPVLYHEIMLYFQKYKKGKDGS